LSRTKLNLPAPHSSHKLSIVFSINKKRNSPFVNKKKITECVPSSHKRTCSFFLILPPFFNRVIFFSTFSVNCFFSQLLLQIRRYCSLTLLFVPSFRFWFCDPFHIFSQYILIWILILIWINIWLPFCLDFESWIMWPFCFSAFKIQFFIKNLIFF